METNKLYVIKIDGDKYWCGNHVVLPDIRKAKIYTSLSQANRVAANILITGEITIELNKLDLESFSFCEIVEIEIKEKAIISKHDTKKV